MIEKLESFFVEAQRLREQQDNITYWCEPPPYPSWFDQGWLPYILAISQSFVFLSNEGNHKQQELDPRLIIWREGNRRRIILLEDPNLDIDSISERISLIVQSGLPTKMRVDMNNICIHNGLQNVDKIKKVGQELGISVVSDSGFNLTDLTIPEKREEVIRVLNNVDGIMIRHSQDPNLQILNNLFYASQHGSCNRGLLDETVNRL